MIKGLASEIESARGEVAEVCSQLVQRPSPHPEGRTVECVKYIQEFFKELGIKTVVHARNSEKPNIVAHLEGESERTIIWLGHLDVVPEGKPESWKYPAYSGKVTSDGYVWGRGTSDMKGACAAAMVAGRILYQRDDIPHNYDLWFTADEEIGGTDGARWLGRRRVGVRSSRRDPAALPGYAPRVSARGRKQSHARGRAPRLSAAPRARRARWRRRNRRN